jgi:hypothetical protein
MDGRWANLGIRASATRRASRGAGAVGQRPWGRGALPPRCRHGETEEGEKKTGKGADVRAPLGSGTRRWVGDRRAGGFGGPTGQMGWWFEQVGRERRWFGGL